VKTSRKLGIGSSLVALLAASAGAETRIHAAVANNYVFRGTSQSDDRPSATAGVDWLGDAGVYAGGNAISVREGAELDAYAGYTRRFGIFAVDAGVNAYEYTGDQYVDGAFREVYVGGQAGPVGLSLYRGDAPFGLRYWYGDLYAGIDAGPVVVELHWGVSDYEMGEREHDQFAGLAGHWRGLDWRVRVTRHEGEEANVVAAIGKSWRLSR
jgi:uncharacterized protein (TIGR02001 family)